MAKNKSTSNTGRESSTTLAHSSPQESEKENNNSINGSTHREAHMGRAQDQSTPFVLTIPPANCDLQARLPTITIAMAFRKNGILTSLVMYYEKSAAPALILN